MRLNCSTTFSLTVILSIAVGFSTSVAAESTLVEKAKEEGKLVAYLAMNAADAVTVQATFEKKFPQIKVDLVRAGAPAMLQRVLPSTAAERSSPTSYSDSVSSITSSAS